MNVDIGDVINQTSFTHYTPNLQVSFRPPKGRVAAMLLLGDADKKAPDTFDAKGALNNLGWVEETELQKAQAELAALREELGYLTATKPSDTEEGNHDVRQLEWERCENKRLRNELGECKGEYDRAVNRVAVSEQRNSEALELLAETSKAILRHQAEQPMSHRLAGLLTKARSKVDRYLKANHNPTESGASE